MIFSSFILSVIGAFVSYEAHKTQLARLKLDVDNAKATEILGFFYALIGSLISIAALTLAWQNPQAYKFLDGALFTILIFSCCFGVSAVLSGALMAFGPKRFKRWVLS